MANKYKIRLPYSLTVEKDYHAILGVGLDQMFDGNVVTDRPVVNKTIVVNYTVVELVNVYTAGLDLLFVSRADIPYFYEEIMRGIEIQRFRLSKGDPKFNGPLTDILFDIADVLYDTYNVRLSKHFYAKKYGKSKLRLTGTPLLNDYKVQRVQRIEK